MSGDITDERGNTLPIPGNGRAKRARIDKEGNHVAENLYYYPATTVSTAVNMRTMFHTTETLNASGAASITTGITLLDASGGPLAISLAAGTYVGQQKIFIMTVAGNAATITPSSFLGTHTTVALDAIGETVHLLWTGAAWAAIGNSEAGANLAVAYA